MVDNHESSYSQTKNLRNENTVDLSQLNQISCNLPKINNKEKIFLSNSENYNNFINNTKENSYYSMFPSQKQIIKVNQQENLDIINTSEAEHILNRLNFKKSISNTLIFSQRKLNKFSTCIPKNYSNNKNSDMPIELKSINDSNPIINSNQDDQNSENINIIKDYNFKNKLISSISDININNSTKNLISFNKYKNYNAVQNSDFFPTLNNENNNFLNTENNYYATSTNQKFLTGSVCAICCRKS